MNFIHSLGAAIVTIGLFVGSLLGYTPVQPQPILGTALPTGTATFESSLASGITSDATTMTLTSVAIRGGSTVSGYECFTIDEGSAQAEYVCGTASSTSVTGLERGISPADGVTQVASLQFSHRRGASVKITDFPLIQRLRSQNAGAGTYENVLQYASGVTPSGGSDLVDVEYLTSVVTGTSTLSYNKIIVNGTAGETLTTGNIVYLNASDSRWYKADNDLSSTYVDQTLGIAQGAGTSGNSISNGVLTYGLDSTQKSMTAGTFIFLSATAGATSTATTSQILGKAVSATTMFFDQNLIDSSVYTPRTFTSTTTFSGPIVGTASTTMRVYTSDSTWVKPTGLKAIIVELVGGGGNGGGATDSTPDTAGAGGGAGGYCKIHLSSNDLSATTTVFVDVGGAGEVTYFSSFASSTAGTAGSNGGTSGGLGGIGKGCDLNINGGGGTAGASDSSIVRRSGAGGDSMYGAGGSDLTSNSDGSGGSGYGAGGGGAYTFGGGNKTGGAGTAGIVIVTEYF